MATQLALDRPRPLTIHDLGIDKSLPKNQIRDELLELASIADHSLSKSRANNLADKYKKGHYDPELEYLLTYQDPVGEAATNNALKPQRCEASVVTHKGLIRCSNEPTTARDARWHTEQSFCAHHLDMFATQATT